MKLIKKIILIISLILLLVGIVFVCMKIKKEDRRRNNELILFLGDSITERYNLNLYLHNFYTVNSGIGGNNTDDILNDMNSRVYIYKPKKVFLLIGINDLLFTTKTDNEIIDNIDKIIKNINDKTNSQIYLESIYPVNINVKKDIPKDSNQKINNFNKKLSKICNKNCEYINMHKNLTDKDGNLKKIYTNDGIHINKLGYIIITNNLYRYLKNNFT